MKRSAIGWCDYSGGDANFVTGCTAVSPGCQNCYARAIYERFGKNFDEVRVHPEKLARLSRAHFGPDNKRGYGSKPLVFVCDTGDLFHPDVPGTFIVEAFYVMRHRQDVDWVVLTKRPQMMTEMLSLPWFDARSYPNVWMGVTAENQAFADQRIPTLLEAWPGKTFVSVEPMLEPMDLEQYVECSLSEPRLDWVICGAESGPGRRTFRNSWADELWKQCKDNGVLFFGKQSGGLRPGEPLYLDGCGYEVHEWPR